MIHVDPQRLTMWVPVFGVFAAKYASGNFTKADFQDRCRCIASNIPAVKLPVQ